MGGGPGWVSLEKGLGGRGSRGLQAQSPAPSSGPGWPQGLLPVRWVPGPWGQAGRPCMWEPNLLDVGACTRPCGGPGAGARGTGGSAASDECVHGMFVTRCVTLSVGSPVPDFKRVRYLSQDRRKGVSSGDLGPGPGQREPVRCMALPPQSLGTCRGLVLPEAVLSQDLPWRLPPPLQPWPHPCSRGLPERPASWSCGVCAAISLAPLCVSRGLGPTAGVLVVGEQSWICPLCQRS